MGIVIRAVQNLVLKERWRIATFCDEGHTTYYYLMLGSTEAEAKQLAADLNADLNGELLADQPCLVEGK